MKRNSSKVEGLKAKMRGLRMRGKDRSEKGRQTFFQVWKTFAYIYLGEEVVWWSEHAEKVERSGISSELLTLNRRAIHFF